MAANSNAKPFPQRVYHFSLYVKKRADSSEEDFSRHWRESHAPLVGEWLKRYDILRYVQHHTPKSLVAATREQWPDLVHVEAQPGDGVVEITVKDVQDFIDARNDPFYIDKVIADEERFVESREDVSWTIGWEEVYIKNNEIVNTTSGGGDGVSN